MSTLADFSFKNVSDPAPRVAVASKIWLVILCSLLICSSRPTSAQPHLVVSPGLRIPCDTVGPRVINSRLVLRNVGNEPLQIHQVYTSCGCTTTELAKTTILPDTQDTMEIRIDLHNQEGAELKEIYINSNDPQDTLTCVAFNFFVLRDLRVFPLMFPAFLGAEKGKSFSSEVQLENSGGDTIKILKVALVSEGLQGLLVGSATAAIPPLGKFPVKLDIVPLKEGYLRGKVHITTNSEITPELVVDIVAFASTRPQNSFIPPHVH